MELGPEALLAASPGHQPPHVAADGPIDHLYVVGPARGPVAVGADREVAEPELEHLSLGHSKDPPAVG